MVYFFLIFFTRRDERKAKKRGKRVIAQARRV